MSKNIQPPHPLLSKEGRKGWFSHWDLLIGHYLGQLSARG